MKSLQTALTTANIAHTTAFLYAGALSDSNGKIDLDVWSGHTGFVQHCAMYAEVIENWVAEQQEQDFPGVYAYELIEPFGQWLVEDCTDRTTKAVLAEFQKRYADWMAAGQAEYAAALAKHDSEANKTTKQESAPHPTPEPQKLIQEPTKILGIDKEQAYAEIITNEGTHLVPQPAKGCHGCVFNNASSELNKPAFEGHWCSDAPPCSDRPDHDSIIWVVKAD